MKTSQFNQYLYEGLDKESKRSVKLWESAGRAIYEAQLTADQIQTLFQQIDQSKGNRTLVGKGVDVGSAVKKAYDDLVSKVQNSGPMKNADALYDQAAAKLKQATGGDQGVMQYVQKYRDFAKKHPIAQSLIYGALIAAAGISGAGVGGAAALGLLKMTDKLLQGEKFSTALGQGLKTGALAYGASKLGDLIKNTLNPSTNSGTITWEATGEGMTSANFKNGKIVGDILYHNQNLSPGDPGYNEAYKAIMDYAKQNGMTGAAASNVQDFGKAGNVQDLGKAGKFSMNALKGGDWQDYEQALNNVNPSMYNAVQDQLNDMNLTDEYKTELLKKLLPFAKSVNDPGKIDRLVDSLSQMADAAVDSADQAALQAAGNPTFESRNLSRKQVQAIFERVVKLNDRMLSEGRLIDRAVLNEGMFDKFTPAPASGPADATASTAQATPTQPKQGMLSKIGGAVKGAAGKALGAVGKGLGKLGHAATTKVTGSTLQKAWEKAGKPTDSVEIEKLLQAQGVNPEVVKTVFQSNKIPVTLKPADPATDTTTQPGPTDNPEVFTPGGNRPAQDAGTPADAGQPQPQGQTDGGVGTPTPQGGQAPTPQGGATPPGAGTPAGTGQPGTPTGTKAFPDVTKYTPPQKQQLITMIDQAIAALGKPAQAGKPHTGGKVAGQTSQTPSAVRQRQARAAKAQPAAPGLAIANPALNPAMKATTDAGGGTTTPTATGYVHKAGANNPNAAFAEPGSTEVKPTATAPQAQAGNPDDATRAALKKRKQQGVMPEAIEYKKFKFLVDGIKARI